MTNLILIVVIFGVGIAGMQFLIRTSPKPPASTKQRPMLSVNWLTVEPKTVTEPIVGFGTARSDRYATVSAQVAGPVLYVAPELEEGTNVAAGHVLLRIDPREFEAQVDRIKSQLAVDEAALRRLAVEEENIARLVATAENERDIAKREYERGLALMERGSSNVREIDQYRMTLEQTRRSLVTFENEAALIPERIKSQAAQVELRRAELAIAALNLERTEISAPIDGRIDRVFAEVGSTVMPGQQLFSMLDPNNIEVPIELPASLQDRVARGANCAVTLASNPSMTWKGRVARIAASADQNTRTFSAFVMVDNREQETQFLPGMFVTAMIEGPELRDVLILPRAVVKGDDVFLYRDGIVQRKPIEIQRILLTNCVVSGLQPGDRVITSNFDAIYDGAAVQLREAETPLPIANPPTNDDFKATARTNAEKAGA
ncbi:MAG: efflux RND transporter periplasmic adaptor subunit [Phycisphaerae bacterium]